ncbi:hypothetical protein D4764_04G0014030 [Takifugu flavidus]|uniref:Uncharacterized protein n=1 Tax=Takifugu flavidus TaxID=433684 RepID=A0A5C6N615_9TELE|nr:hypothetical protein D4764_04G0014030 [Takifugu flavidus]
MAGWVEREERRGEERRGEERRGEERRGNHDPVVGLISPVPTTSSANVAFCGQSRLTSSVSLPIATVNKRGFSLQSFLHLELLCHSFTFPVPHSSNRCPGPFYSLSQTVDMMA